jgi:hypothetical protein
MLAGINSASNRYVIFLKSKFLRKIFWFEIAAHKIVTAFQRRAIDPPQHNVIAPRGT